MEGRREGKGRTWGKGRAQCLQNHPHQTELLREGGKRVSGEQEGVEGEKGKGRMEGREGKEGGKGREGGGKGRARCLQNHPYQAELLREGGKRVSGEEEGAEGEKGKGRMEGLEGKEGGKGREGGGKGRARCLQNQHQAEEGKLGKRRGAGKGAVPTKPSPSSGTSREGGRGG